MKTAIVVLLVALSACTSGHQVWSKPGGTQQELTAVDYECDKDMHQSHGFGSVIDQAIFWEHCMNAHGWYAVSTQH